MQEETKLKIKVMNLLKALDHCWFVKVQQVAIVGTPDIVGCYKGHFFAFELKTDEGKLAAMQQYTLGKIHNAGGFIEVVTPSNYLTVIKEMEKLTWQKR